MLFRSFNLWNGCTFTNSFYYAPDWAQIADPELTVNDKSYVISLPQATFQQWQAQVFFHTSLSAASDKSYDFRCVLNSNQDLSNITVKLFKNGDNDTFFFAKVISLTADEDYDFKMPKMAGLDIDKIDLVFDFGGNPANTTVTVSEVLLKDATQN